ncbi:hypothetical protein BJ912DRAFT_280641 [Pholiota molesta]|nr:hypothetical protein BJ912DRAFT_280641 [Pholiota molesta]
MDPTNFVNATWSINSLQVYRKQLIAGNASALQASSARPALHADSAPLMQMILPMAAVIVMSLVW